MDFEGIYCFDTAAVRFAIYPDGHDGARIIGQISEETLHDVFGTRDLGDRLLETCKAHFDAIGAAALKRYRTDPNQPIVLTVDDFPSAFRPAPAARKPHRRPRRWLPENAAPGARPVFAPGRVMGNSPTRQGGFSLTRCARILCKLCAQAL